MTAFLQQGSWLETARNTFQETCFMFAYTLTYILRVQEMRGKAETMLRIQKGDIRHRKRI